MFDPNPVTKNQGDTVTSTNRDTGMNTVTEDQKLFTSKDLRPNQTFEYTFDPAGTFDNHIKLHPTML